MYQPLINKKTSKKKNAGTQDRIISYVRGEILSGEYKPGKVLPPRTFFVEKFGTTLITVQRAFNFLIANGFVTSKSRAGTYVAERPVNLFRYALVFSRSPQHGNWSRFWQLMFDLKTQIENQLDIDIVIYQGLDYGESCHDYQRFLDACRDKSFAGIIFTGELHNFPVDTYQDFGIPMTCISSLEIPQNISRIVLNTKQFYKLCAQKLSELNCVKVGVVAADFFDKEKEDLLRDAFLSEEIVYHKNYTQGVTVRERFWARRFVNLLLEFTVDDKFDALLVLDDNLLPEVLKGVDDSGLTVGRDIQVISHANLPIDENQYPGVHFVGYSTISIIQRGIDQLRELKKSEIYIDAEC